MLPHRGDQIRHLLRVEQRARLVRVGLDLRDRVSDALRRPHRYAPMLAIGRALPVLRDQGGQSPTETAFLHLRSTSSAMAL